MTNYINDPDVFTLGEPIRVVDLTSPYQGKWYIETKENVFMYLNIHGDVVDCLDDDTVMDDLYFPSKNKALATALAYATGIKPACLNKVTSDIESQVMEF